jgi:hypothetical protein
MAVEVQDILSIDAVFADLELLQNDEEVAACSAALGSEIITEVGLVLGASRGAPAQGRRLQIPRDRMRMEASAHRTRVLREYPADIDDVASVVRLTRQASDSTDLQGAVPSSFGFNLELVYDQDSGEPALAYLGARLFAGASHLHERWGQVGGFGKLVVPEGTWQWTIQLEPRFQAPDTTKVFLGANLHVAEARMPDEGDMEVLLRELWGRVHEVIENLDGRDHA